jgi:hypothetical protein
METLFANRHGVTSARPHCPMPRSRITRLRLLCRSLDEVYHAEADRGSQGDGHQREPHLDIEPHLMMLLALLGLSVAEFEPRLHLAEDGSTTRRIGESCMSFRLSMRGTRPAQAHKPGGGACGTRIRTQLYSKCRCACRRHQRCHCGERSFGTSPFFGQFSGKQLPARIWHVGCRGVKHNGGPSFNQVRSLLSGLNSPRGALPKQIKTISPVRGRNAGMRRAGSCRHPEKRRRPRAFCPPAGRN